MINDDINISNAEDMISEEDGLLFSTFPGPRLLILNNASQTNLLGVVLEETEDSFLVGLPSRLIDSGSDLQVEPFVKVPYLRLLKSSVLTVLYLFDVFKEKYLAYLIEHGTTLYPDLSDIVEDLKEQYAAPAISPKETSEEKLGMSDEDLEEYLSEKLQRGEILNGTGSKH